MNIKRVYAAYFSPTGGTKAYVKAIAAALSEDYEEIDLTRPQVREEGKSFEEGDLVILGAPVYAGRLPHLPGGIFECLKGNGAWAVLNVSYGNREFDDALLEEKEICEAQGFCPVAAGAWLAPHTFSGTIAQGRPDEEDLKKALEFAAQVKGLMEDHGDEEESGDTADQQPAAWTLKVPGNHPYKPLKTSAFCPQAGEDCTACGLCAKVCPTGAIDKEHPSQTDPEKCIACHACLKNCPVHARKVDLPAFEETVKRLEGNLLARRKEPETFLGSRTKA